MLHLRLNTGKSPIVNKYRKGKMQRTLQRESKESEIAEGVAIEVIYTHRQQRKWSLSPFPYRL